MKTLMGALVLVASFAVSADRDEHGRGEHERKGHGDHPSAIATPEIDGDAGRLAIALIGGGLILLKLSRRAETPVPGCH